MEEVPFNAKKSRAHKLQRDKVHHKHKTSSGENAKGKVDPNVKTSESTKSMKESHGNACHTSTLKSEVAPPSSETKLFKKRAITSNWERYEQELNTTFSDTEESSASKFEELVNVPITGGHFRLKHEYDWEKERAEIQAPWFQLDLEKLNNALSTIPFFKRHNIPSNMFSEEKIQQLIQSAQKSRPLQKINDLLGITGSEPISNTNNEGHQPSKVVQEPAKSVTSSNSLSNDLEVLRDKDLDQLLSLDESKVIRILTDQTETVSLSAKDNPVSPEDGPGSVISVAQSVPQATSASLDDWLDSILDD